MRLSEEDLRRHPELARMIEAALNCEVEERADPAGPLPPRRPARPDRSAWRWVPWVWGLALVAAIMWGGTHLPTGGGTFDGQLPTPAVPASPQPRDLAANTAWRPQVAAALPWIYRVKVFFCQSTPEGRACGTSPYWGTGWVWDRSDGSRWLITAGHLVWPQGKQHAVLIQVWRRGRLVAYWPWPRDVAEAFSGTVPLRQGTAQGTAYLGIDYLALPWPAGAGRPGGLRLSRVDPASIGSGLYLAGYGCDTSHGPCATDNPPLSQVFSLAGTCGPGSELDSGLAINLPYECRIRRSQPGDSGGPWLNAHGHVVGISNTLEDYLPWADFSQYPPFR